MVRIGIRLFFVALLVSTCGPQKGRSSSAGSKDGATCRQLRGDCVSLFAAIDCGDFKATPDCQDKPDHGCCFSP